MIRSITARAAGWQRLLSSLTLIAASGTVLLASGCDSNPVGPVPNGDTTAVDLDIPASEGQVGVVLDVREIFRKGYTPTEAEIAFPDFPALNTTLEVDHLTTLAILSVARDSLTEDQKAAFAAGVATTVTIRNSLGDSLASFSDEGLVLDASNEPLSISNPALPYTPPSIVLADDIAYLLQVQGYPDVVTYAELRWSDVIYTERYEVSYPYPDATERVAALTANGYEHRPGGQLFYFSQVSDSAYEVRQPTSHAVAETFVDPLWCTDAGTYITVRDAADCVTPARIILQQEASGWVRLKLEGQDSYLQWGRAGSVYPVLGLFRFVSRGDADLFRLMSDDIVWDVRDRGTAYNQPIVPPAKVDLAYETSITNCSSAEVTEEIGRTQSRTTTATFGGTESLQVFSSRTLGFGVKITAGVNADAGTVFAKAGASLDVEASFEANWTRSETTTTDSTWSTETSETVEVSRSRSVVLPPYSGIRATDVLRSINNVVIPWTQTLRITAYSASTGRPLSGAEIRTQLRFNLVGALTTLVGADFLDVSVRGSVTQDHFFSGETVVEDIPDACGS